MNVIPLPETADDAGAVRSDAALLAAFKQAMRHHAAGVCIISVGAGEAVNGMAATAVTSFSMHPPSMLACVNEAASAAASLREGAPFGITLLGSEDQAVAAAFSHKPSGRIRYADPRWRLRTGTLPVLEGGPANIACVVERWLSYGSHRAVIGRVVDVELGVAGASLIYCDGTYQ